MLACLTGARRHRQRHGGSNPTGTEHVSLALVVPANCMLVNTDARKANSFGAEVDATSFTKDARYRAIQWLVLRPRLACMADVSIHETAERQRGRKR
jgi:hypothetical protein